MGGIELFALVLESLCRLFEIVFARCVFCCERVLDGIRTVTL